MGRCQAAPQAGRKLSAPEAASPSQPEALQPDQQHTASPNQRLTTSSAEHSRGMALRLSPPCTLTRRAAGALASAASTAAAAITTALPAAVWVGEAAPLSASSR